MNQIIKKQVITENCRTCLKMVNGNSLVSTYCNRCKDKNSLNMRKISKRVNGVMNNGVVE